MIQVTEAQRGSEESWEVAMGLCAQSSDRDSDLFQGEV